MTRSPMAWAAAMALIGAGMASAHDVSYRYEPRSGDGYRAPPKRLAKKPGPMVTGPKKGPKKGSKAARKAARRKK